MVHLQVDRLLTVCSFSNEALVHFNDVSLPEWTPLHTAASNGNIASMELLLNFKATLEITDKVDKMLQCHDM